MPSSELRGWVKYLAIEPFNSTDMQLAMLAQIYNNSMGGKASFDDMLFTTYRKEKTSKDAINSRPSDDEVKLAFGVFKQSS